MDIMRRFRLWRWDCKNRDILALAVRLQTCLIGDGKKSPRLQWVIDRLVKQRSLIEYGRPTK